MSQFLVSLVLQASPTVTRISVPMKESELEHFARKAIDEIVERLKQTDLSHADEDLVKITRVGFKVDVVPPA